MDNNIQQESIISEAPVITDKKNEMKKCYSKIALWLGLSYIITIVVSIILSVVFKSLTDSSDPVIDENIANMIVSFAPMYVICFPLIILILSRMKKTALEKTKLGAGRIFSLTSMVFPIILAGNIIGTFLSGVLSSGKAENSIVEMVTAFNPLAILIGSFIGPIFEEIVFRKMIIDRTVRYGEKAAILFSALCFGMYHMNLFQFFYTFGFGLILGYIYVRSGDVKLPIILHIAINSLNTIIVPFLIRQSAYYEFIDMLTENTITEQFIIENTAFFEEHLIWILLFLLYVFLYYAMIIVGVIMLITKRKKLEIHEREEQIPDKTGIRTAFVNIGMIIFAVITIGMITLSLLSAANT